MTRSSSKHITRSRSHTKETENVQKKRRRKTDTSAIATVDRAAGIFHAFTESTESLTLAEIAKLSGVPKPTTFRILTTLAAEGLVIYDESTESYTFGYATLRMADTVLNRFPIRESARPVMRRIRDAVNETVVLSIRVGDERYNIDSLESTHAIGNAQQIGVAIPLYTGAASLALLAAIPNDAVDAYLKHPREASSKQDAPQPEHIRQTIKRIRALGYAVSSGESELGSHAIAAAIADPHNGAIAALHVSIPDGRFSPELQKRSIVALLQGIRSIRKMT